MNFCRVYLFTYKRNELLKRAVKSLINQTFTDWVCEIHNDLPGDAFPGNYIGLLNDNRLSVINHPVNLGTTVSFNFAFAGCDEKYASMLEDDNWWEPTFLEEMIAVMEHNPKIDICWSNMFTWNELPGNRWQKTGDCLWPENDDVLFDWPNPKQAIGALHSTGAMIYRGSKAKDYIIPVNTLSNAVELVRERTFNHPIYLVSKPLANFAHTIVTSQSRDTVKWTGTQTMMLASCLCNSDHKKAEIKKLLTYYRPAHPSPIPVFFLAIFFYVKDFQLLFNFNLRDWMLITRWCLANFFNLQKLSFYLKSQKETWDFLKSHNPGLGKK